MSPFWEIYQQISKEEEREGKIGCSSYCTKSRWGIILVWYCLLHDLLFIFQQLVRCWMVCYNGASRLMNYDRKLFHVLQEKEGVMNMVLGYVVTYIMIWLGPISFIIPLDDVLDLNDVSFVPKLRKNLFWFLIWQSFSIELHLKHNDSLSMIVF